VLPIEWRPTHFSMVRIREVKPAWFDPENMVTHKGSV
jgi:hypothetical protein